ncbi:MAG: ABC transporter ATP-binding protein [Victivallales bacterium]|nr:ABC transporter ATP-binding protein [Victivallales bacterium]
MHLEVRHLKKYYAKVRAVDDLSFSLESGQVYAFVGPNGAGKTTTFNILAGLEQPDSGDCLIDGVSVIYYPEKVHHLIGFMTDSTPNFSDIKVWQYIDFFAVSAGLRGAGKQRRIKEIEQLIKIDVINDKLICDLSKGMKQRVSLARMLVKDPKILFLDEPAAGLDPRARVELRDIVRELQAQGKTIVISSHILSELEDMCNGVIIIDKGRLIHSGGLKAETGSTTFSEKPNVTMILRCQAEFEKVKTVLSALAVCSDFKEQDDKSLSFNLCQPEKSNEILALLIKEKIIIQEFYESRRKLEKMFMDLTRGEVQ